MPPILSYAHFLTPTAAARAPSAIRSLQPLLKTPGMLSLGGGMPNPSTFPIESISFRLTSGAALELDPQETREALQYAPTPGLASLHKYLIELQRSEHRPPREENIRVCVSTGSQESLACAFSALIKAGDSVLVESPTYSGSLAYLHPLGAQLTGIPTDGEGLIPSECDRILTSWPSDKHFPRVLYTIPTGANPSGGSMTLERKQDLYAIAQRFDLLIIEDDPYYYLQFSPTLTPSLLSLDTDGRVLRFDSLSKIISAGMRLGFATGPKGIMERIEMHLQASSLHASALTQAVVKKLLDYWGGIDGFRKHSREVALFYRSQRDEFLCAADKHLTGLAEWNVPNAGMFVWIRVFGVDDTEQLIKEQAVNAKVLLVPGTAFMPHGAKSPHVRASFSTSTPEEIDEALRRFAGLLRVLPDKL